MSTATCYYIINVSSLPSLMGFKKTRAFQRDRNQVDRNVALLSKENYFPEENTIWTVNDLICKSKISMGRVIVNIIRNALRCAKLRDLPHLQHLKHWRLYADLAERNILHQFNDKINDKFTFKRCSRVCGYGYV